MACKNQIRDTLHDLTSHFIFISPVLYVFGVIRCNFIFPWVWLSALHYEFCGKSHSLSLNKSREESKYACIVQYTKVHGEHTLKRRLSKKPGFSCYNHGGLGKTNRTRQYDTCRDNKVVIKISIRNGNMSCKSVNSRSLNQF